MAVLLNTVNDYLSRASALTVTSFTVMGWCYVVADQGAPVFQPILAATQTFGTDGDVVFAWEHDDTGSGMGDGIMGGHSYDGANYNATTNGLSSRPAVATWFHWYVKCAGSGSNQVELGWSTTGSTYVSAQITLAAGSTGVVGLRLGNGAGTWLNARFADYKQWSTALTLGQIQAEFAQEAPVLLTNLTAYNPLSGPTSATWGEDLSGNGAVLTTNGTPTFAAGPPQFDVTVTFTQTRYRWRNDDGNETAAGATPAAAENTAMTAPAGVNRRLRVQVATALGDPPTAALQLEWQLSTSPGYVRVNPVVAANPTVAWRDTFTSGTGNATSFNVPWDAGVPTAGQLLLLFYSVDGAETCTINTGTFPGWVKLGDQASTTINTLSVFYKVATGGETNVTVGHGAQQASAIVLCVNNGGTPVGSSVSGNSTNANPPNRNPGVSAAYLWVAAAGWDGATNVVATAAPTTPGTYTNLTSAPRSSTTGASVSTAERIATASAEDPGVFTSTAEDWAAWTISVPPVTPAALALALSSNFAPGATTAQLTAPGGTTFGGGRIEEAANPATTVDLALDQYGEWEWCVQAHTSIVTDGQVIECRVTRAGTVLDTYTVTPSWTIGTPVAGGGTPLLAGLLRSRMQRRLVG